MWHTPSALGQMHEPQATSHNSQVTTCLRPVTSHGPMVCDCHQAINRMSHPVRSTWLDGLSHQAMNRMSHPASTLSQATGQTPEAMSPRYSSFSAACLLMLLMRFLSAGHKGQARDTRVAKMCAHLCYSVTPRVHQEVRCIASTVEAMRPSVLPACSCLTRTSWWYTRASQGHAMG